MNESRQRLDNNTTRKNMTVTEEQREMSRKSVSDSRTGVQRNGQEKNKFEKYRILSITHQIPNERSVKVFNKQAAVDFH